MKNMFILVCLLFFGGCVQAVSPGSANIELYKTLLAGKKIGIVANQTAVVGDKHTVDFLRENGMEIVRIFCPEHGFRGDVDAGEAVGDYKDKATGLPVVSLIVKLTVTILYFWSSPIGPSHTVD
mgnify:CR=1 FL=1